MERTDDFEHQQIIVYNFFSKNSVHGFEWFQTFNKLYEKKKNNSTLFGIIQKMYRFIQLKSKIISNIK